MLLSLRRRRTRHCSKTPKAKMSRVWEEDAAVDVAQGSTLMGEVETKDPWAE